MEEVINIDLNSGPPNSSVNFGPGIELLMNDKKKTNSDSTTIEIDDLDKLESDMNNLSDSINIPGISTNVFSVNKDQSDINLNTDNIEDMNDSNLGNAMAGGIGNTQTWDGFNKFNEIPNEPIKPKMNEREMRRKKRAMLKKLDEWYEKGHVKNMSQFDINSPFDEVEDLLIEEPEWNGLSDIERTRLAAALDQVTQLDTRANQMPLRNRAVFILGLNTGLRANELSTLDFGQYEDGYLRKVKGKGRAYADVYVNKEAQKELDTYIKKERGTEPGPLFITNRGGRMIRQQIDRSLRRVMNHANSKVPEGEEIKLHAHKLRHTSTKRIYEKKGPIAAQKHGRHQSLKQLARYAAETREEREASADDIWS